MSPHSTSADMEYFRVLGLTTAAVKLLNIGNERFVFSHYIIHFPTHISMDRYPVQ